MVYISGAKLKGCRSRPSKNIVDIMLPTTGIIEFTGLERSATTPQSEHFSFSILADTTISPVSATSPSLSPLESQSESDEAWNLVPYHVSWGHEYHAYRPGKLPGPDGDCILLRSPTPLKNQRTTEACKKCRERKAKCSGTRPSCARCSARGFDCEYASEESADNSSVAKMRKLRREAPTYPTVSFSDDSCYSTTSATSNVGHGPLTWSQPSVQTSSIKLEDTSLAFDMGTCDGYATGSYWESPATAGELWSMPYVSSPVAADVFADGSDPYDNPHAVLAPQPIRRSSVMQLEVPGDSASESSSSSTIFDSTGDAFTSGALTPITGSSSAPSPELESKLLLGYSTSCLEARASHYIPNNPGLLVPFDGPWMNSPANATFTDPYTTPSHPQFTAFAPIYASQS